MQHHLEPPTPLTRSPPEEQKLPLPLRQLQTRCMSLTYMSNMHRLLRMLTRCLRLSTLGRVAVNLSLGQGLWYSPSHFNTTIHMDNKNPLLVAKVGTAKIPNLLPRLSHPRTRQLLRNILEERLLRACKPPMLKTLNACRTVRCPLNFLLTQMPPGT